MTYQSRHGLFTVYQETGIKNETTGYMAAAVKAGGKNRYHIHRILMPDGSEFQYKEKTEPIGAGITVNNGKGSAISSVSDNSVPNNSKKARRNSPSRMRWKSFTISLRRIISAPIILKRRLNLAAFLCLRLLCQATWKDLQVVG